MGALKLQRLREVLRKTYEAGHKGCMDLCNDYVEEAIQSLTTEMTHGKSGDGKWRIYTVEELKKREPGTAFEHSRLGPCKIVIFAGEKMMEFSTGERHFMVQNNEPYDEEMVELPK